MLVGFLLLVLSFIPSGGVLAQGAVCPAGDVKWEEGSGYEYTDGSATITGDENQVTITISDGYVFVSGCIKIGGPGGGSTISISGPGTYGPFDYGISHVVVSTDPEPTPTPEATPTPTPPVEEPTPTPTPPTEATPTPTVEVTPTPTIEEPTPTPPLELPPTAGPAGGMEINFALQILGAWLMLAGGALSALQRRP